MSRAEVRQELIKALAAKKRRAPADLEAELLKSGSECPCDSQWLVKAGVGAARAIGIPFKPANKDAWAFKSIETMATYLHECLQKAAAA